MGISVFFVTERFIFCMPNIKPFFGMKITLAIDLTIFVLFTILRWGSAGGARDPAWTPTSPPIVKIAKVVYLLPNQYKKWTKSS